MTATTRFASTTKTLQTAEVEMLLRDAAYVLRLTRRIKHDILSSAVRPIGNDVAREVEAAPTALGV